MHVLMIAISFPSPENPYPGIFIAEQVRLLCDHVDRITVLCPSPRVPTFVSMIPSLHAKGSLPVRYYMGTDRCEVLFPRYLKAPGNLFLSWTKAQWYRIVSNTLSSLDKEHPVSIIHANAGSVSGWAAIKAARRYGRPCAVTYQGSEVHDILVNRKKGWRLCRDSFRFADLNISVSRSIESTLKQHVMPQGRCEVLLRGVDQRKFFPPLEGVRKPIVLFVGRISMAKGAFDLLEAWKNVISVCPDAQLWMIGPDHTHEAFIRKASSREYGGSIEVTGPLPAADVAKLMRQTQILCLPSHGEGTPNCVMEAMASGLPVVATRVGGIPEIVVHGATGLLVEKGDVKRLANALITLLRDPDRCIRMGKAASEFAATHLDIRNAAGRLFQLYQETIAAYEERRGERTQSMAYYGGHESLSKHGVGGTV
jgi:glycosyltransferase involved in cell wall biosynthesis